MSNTSQISKKAILKVTFFVNRKKKWTPDDAWLIDGNCIELYNYEYLRMFKSVYSIHAQLDSKVFSGYGYPISNKT